MSPLFIESNLIYCFAGTISSPLRGIISNKESRGEFKVSVPKLWVSVPELWVRPRGKGTKLGN